MTDPILLAANVPFAPIRRLAACAVARVVQKYATRHARRAISQAEDMVFKGQPGHGSQWGRYLSKQFPDGKVQAACRAAVLCMGTPVDLDGIVREVLDIYPEERVVLGACLCDQINCAITDLPDLSSCRTPDVLSLLEAPPGVLADALEEAGAPDPILAHLRGPYPCCRDRYYPPDEYTDCLLCQGSGLRPASSHYRHCYVLRALKGDHARTQ